MKTGLGKRPDRALMSGIDRVCGFPGPWQQFVVPIDWMSIGHARVLFHSWCKSAGGFARRINISLQVG